MGGRAIQGLRLLTASASGCWGPEPCGEGVSAAATCERDGVSRLRLSIARFSSAAGSASLCLVLAAVAALVQPVFDRRLTLSPVLLWRCGQRPCWLVTPDCVHR